MTVPRLAPFLILTVALVVIPVSSAGDEAPAAADFIRSAGPSAPDLDRIHGRIQFVEAFPDFTIRWVD